MSDNLNDSSTADHENTDFTTPPFIPSSSQESAPPDSVPSSSPNVTGHQVQTAQVLAPERPDPIVNPTLHN